VYTNRVSRIDVERRDFFDWQSAEIEDSLRAIEIERKANRKKTQVQMSILGI